MIFRYRNLANAGLAKPYSRSKTFKPDLSVVSDCHIELSSQTDYFRPYIVSLTIACQMRWLLAAAQRRFFFKLASFLKENTVF